jgi:peroxiredoxin
MINVAVTLIGVLSLLNLALTFVVIKQMRRRGGQAANRGAPGGPRPWHLAAGSAAPEFTVQAVSGETVSLSDLTGARSVVAFFSVGCPPCRMQLPELKAYARSVPGGAAQVLAVVCGAADEAADYVRELADAATVVVEPIAGPAAQAFSVSAYPTIYVLDERGRIETSGGAVRQVATSAPA